ncbi:hypothetical protein OAG34_01380 [bacterium]|nr:hypothetical protein [Rhodopirellula sp.]MDB4759845.1 hypothetical protein [bacterium]
MRRRQTQTDSFDLFLDTICNTFGGIIFMAILVAILIQTRSVLHEPEQTDQTTHTPQEMRELQARLTAAESSVQRLSIALESMPEINPSDDFREYVETTSELERIEQNILQMIADSKAKSNELEVIIANNETLKEENDNVPERLRSLTELAQKEEAAVSELINTKQTTLKLPREKESSAESTLALLKGDLLYLAGEFDGIRDEFDGPHIDTKKALGGFRVLPSAGKGVDAENSEAVSFLSRTVRQGQIVTLAVWPDSFGLFAELKPKLIESGLRYQIWIQSPNTDLIVSIGSGNRSRAQ